jgi:hypothetical protein
MKQLTHLSFAAMAAIALTAAPALAAAPAAKSAAPAPAKPAYHKLEEEKWLGMGTGKYTLQGQPIALTEKPWWYGWTPDTTFNTGLTSDKFRAVLAASPDALANAQGRDGIRTIGMIANIAPRAATLVAIIPLATMVKDPKTMQLSAYGLVGMILLGVVADWGTELLTFNSLGHTVDLYNRGAKAGAAPLGLSDPLADQRTNPADFSVGLARIAF